MKDVCIIGMGRVGLPLALSLEEKGLDVIGIDIDDEVMLSVASKEMPFYEPKYEELIKTSNIRVYNPNTHRIIPEANVYIITVGTPLDQHIETNLTAVKKVIDNLIKRGIENKLIILRSTVAPYTTQYLKNYIENTNLKVGENVFLAMCPERIAEGKAYEEFTQLPQIIGVEDDESFNKACNLFKVLEIKCFKASYIEAELTKLFCNIYRYINFAIPNYFAYVANEFNIDIFKLFKIMNTDYPRNSGLKNPGFASGTCLRKDFGMINEYFPQTDMILQAYKVNEYMPKFYVDLVKDEIKGKTIGILGYTMKADTDDTRDSLVPKLIRYIERNNPIKVLIAEPNLNYGMINDEFNNLSFYNYDKEAVISESDIIFIAMNHKSFKELKNENMEDFKDKIIVDVWGLLNKSIVLRNGL